MKKVSVSPLDLQKQSNHKQYMIREIYFFLLQLTLEHLDMHMYIYLKPTI